MTPREEALNAIDTVAGMLAKPDMNALDRRLALATLDHAREQVGLIQELKRARRAPTSTGEPA